MSVFLFYETFPIYNESILASGDAKPVIASRAKVKMVYWSLILPGLPNFGGWNPETIVEIFIFRNIMNKKRVRREVGTNLRKSSASIF